MSASHRTTVGIDATGTIAELADIRKGGAPDGSGRRRSQDVRALENP
jgi:hypothetical protein